MVLALGAAAAVIATRIDAVTMPQLDSEHQAQRKSSGDTVYLFVGADSGIERAATDIQRDTPDGQARADALVLVRLGADGTASAVSLPRDLLSTDGYFGSIALALLDGPDVLMESVCSTTGVAVDRYVSIDGSGFVDAIDALRGIEVDIEYPLRDPAAELSIDTAGTQRVDGATALGLVRSRHGEQFVDGAWVSVSESEGARQRALWSARVLDGVRSALSDADVASLTRAVWSGSASLSLGGGLHPFELGRLARAELDIRELPAEKIGDGRALQMNEQSASVLTDAGFRTDCSLD
ncbi:LCP family protein [Leucobacter sp. L43]|uniref:LCP family protein n=1 Tax=Leucobacter sp. L43 TaxID=2798040 RepID=UPI0019030376